jgi:predicted permease
VIISGFGSLLGIGAAVLALPWVRRLGGARIPRLEEATLDPVGAVAASGIVVLAVAVAGLAPALSLRGGAPASALRGSGRGGGSWGGGVRRTLVGVQVAMSVVLLLGTGLLFRSFVRLSQVDPGFDPNDRVTLTLAMPDAAYSWQERGPLVREILRLGREVPGVEALGATAVDPFSGYALANFIASATDMPDRAEDFTPIQWRVVTPGLFDALGLDVLAGRAFNDTDDGREGHPVIIDQRLANDLFGDPAEAVGRDLVWGDPEGSRIRVVGVVEALRDVELQADPFPMVYRSHRAIPWASMHLVARVADGAGPGVAAGLREAVRTAAPRLAVPDVESLQANVDRALAEPRFNVLLLGAFAVVGLALAVVGLYGLTAFEVRRRFREIGIRMSLGADATTLVKGFVTQRLGLAAVGLAVGMALAFPAARWLEALLFETSVADPLTWVGVAVTVIATTAVASWIPARRASDVDPREVLSAE